MLLFHQRTALSIDHSQAWGEVVMHVVAAAAAAVCQMASLRVTLRPALTPLIASSCKEKHMEGASQATRVKILEKNVTHLRNCSRCALGIWAPCEKPFTSVHKNCYGPFSGYLRPMAIGDFHHGGPCYRYVAKNVRAIGFMGTVTTFDSSSVGATPGFGVM